MLFAELSDFDVFLFYGRDLDTETIILEAQVDVQQELIQPRRSLWYHRSFGAGVPNYENFPLGVFMQVGIPYDVVQAITRRNSEVTNGQDGLPDRRIAISQNNVRVEQDAQGNTDVEVTFLPLIAAQKPRALEGEGIGAVY